MGDDVTCKMLVYQPRGGELGFVRGGKGFSEGTLVVVEVFSAIIFALDLWEWGALVLCNRGR